MTDIVTDVPMVDVNDSASGSWYIPCAERAPTAQHFLMHMPSWGYAILAIYFVFTICTIAIYAEEVHFIAKNFKRKLRRRSTIWILAYFPVFSISGFFGVIMPRSATLVDLVSSAFFGTCLYQFVGLMTNYMGGPRRMWDIVGETRSVKTNTPPCCCCCPCLPDKIFNRKTYFKWTLLVMQIAVVRPILMFLAAVLWANGSYHPGILSIWNGYSYIVIVNLITTLPAMYGLFLLKNALTPELEQKFSLAGKIASLQLTMISTAVPNLIISFLVTYGHIECTPLFPSKARGETLAHGVLVILMLPYALIGRKFFHREEDGYEVADHPSANGNEEHVREVMTIDKNGKKALVTITQLDDEDSLDGDGRDRVVVKIESPHDPHELVMRTTTF